MLSAISRYWLADRSSRIGHVEESRDTEDDSACVTEMFVHLKVVVIESGTRDEPVVDERVRPTLGGPAGASAPESCSAFCGDGVGVAAGVGAAEGEGEGAGAGGVSLATGASPSASPEGCPGVGCAVWSLASVVFFDGAGFTRSGAAFTESSRSLN